MEVEPRTSNGTVDTVVRFRPFLKSEVAGSEKAGKSCAAFHKSGKKVQIKYGIDTPREFVFDSVMKTDVQQDAVFDAIGPKVATTIMDVCFGSRGSGKTYTCFSGGVIKQSVTSKSDGLFPRIVREVFNRIFDAAEDEKSEFTMKFSCYEVSLDEIADLSVEGGGNVECLVDEETNEVILDGIIEEFVGNEDELFELLQAGLHRRKPDHSTIAEMTVSHHRVDTNTTVSSRLTIMDLDKFGQETLQEVTVAIAEQQEYNFFESSIIFGRVFINALVHSIACCSPSIELVKSNTLPNLEFAELIKQVDVCATQNYLLEEMLGEVEQINEDGEVILPGSDVDQTSETAATDTAAVAAAAAKYNELEKRHQETQNELTKLKANHQETQQTLRKSLFALRSQCKAIRSQHAQLQKQSNNSFEATKSAILDGVSTQIETKLRHILNKSQNMSASTTQILENERTQHKSEISRAQERIQTLERESDVAKERMQEKKKRIEQLDVDVIKITTQNEELEFELQNSELQIQNLLIKMEEADNETNAYRQQLQHKQEQIDSLQSQLETNTAPQASSEETEQLKQKVSELEVKITTEAENFNRERDYTNEFIERLRRNLDESEQEIDRLNQEKKKLQDSAQASEETLEVKSPVKVVEKKFTDHADRFLSARAIFENNKLAENNSPSKPPPMSRLNSVRNDSEIKKLKEELQEETKRRQKYQNEVKEVYEQMDKLRTATTSKFQLQQLQSTVNDVNEQLGAMRQRASNAEMEVVRVKAEFDHLQQSVVRSEQRVQQLTDDCQALNISNEQLKSELIVYQRGFESAQEPTNNEQVRQLQELIADKNYELENADQNNKDAKNNIATLQAQIKEIESDHSSQIQQLQLHLTNAQSSCVELREEKSELISRLDKLQRELVELNKKKNEEVINHESNKIEDGKRPRRIYNKVLIDEINEQQRTLAMQEQEQQATRLHELSEKVKMLEQRNRAMSKMVDQTATTGKKIVRKDRSLQEDGQPEAEEEEENDAVAAVIDQDEDVEEEALKPIESDQSEWVAMMNPLFNPLQVANDYESDSTATATTFNQEAPPAERSSSMVENRRKSNGSSLLGAFKRISIINNNGNNGGLGLSRGMSKMSPRTFTSESIDEHTFKTGFLLKKSKNSVMENWKRFWFKVHHSNMLSAFIDLGDVKPLETLDLRKSSVVTDKANQGRKYVFVITMMDGRTHHFAANNEYERREWMETLKKCSGSE
ncbi:kinesin heavy chain [Acrasis kona]|uniref:Kinesin heavy chain n=1 Tax=Acrasis kona TaxID=1008807 RepID=A0AAW2Z9T2_9EUKA